mmetsp:Transcript_9463/g.14514  ORF Transcript_9463/g.14514 Transcript_9463/m.14514 type:complete len:99 (+) Transcript_9463:241-537(+)
MRCECVPSSETAPCSTTAMASEFLMVESLCAMTRVVRLFCLWICSRASCTMRSFSLSSALVASSRRKILGSLSMALASATRCFCPPESSMDFSPTSVS